MCGIAGILNRSDTPVSQHAVEKMTDSIAHRGPDGHGVYLDGAFGLGHRRLAILDPSPAGHQPMADATGRFVVSYNGAVYNFRELRTELQGLGHRFVSTGDTEVVLHAWMEWGQDALLKFNGMFALAIWDSQARELVVARDRYGIKPLYYTHTENALLFASEIKAIVACDDYKTTLDREALVEYFTFQNFFTDRTLFKGVKILPAGTFVRVKADNIHAAQPVRYWDYHFTSPEKQVDEREYLEELQRLFIQAVNRQLVSDVPVGSYLSGGIDSGSITAIAARQLPYIKTFTCGFDMSSASGLELAFDERVNAEHMSYLFKTEHYEMVLKSGDMERVMPQLTWHLDEPRVGQSYPNFYAAQLASKFVKVVLGGTGGDELFGGYPWRYYRAVVNDDFDHYISKYYSFWQRLIPQNAYQEVFKPIWSDVSHVDPQAIFRNVFADHAERLTTPEDYVNHSLYFEAKTFLHGLLVVEDKLSMAHGLEARVPFLDNDLVDFAMKVPVNLKLGNLAEVVRLDENEPGVKTTRFFNKTKDGKLLLRRAMENIIPKAVTDRAKQGFSAPDASWFKGDSIDYVRSRLLSPDAAIFNYLDFKTTTSLVNEHLSGKTNRRLLIWSLLNVDEVIEQVF